MKDIDKKFDIKILYEKLPNICYVCGRLNHLMDECHLLTSEDPSKELLCQYGDWLGAPEFKKKIIPNRNWIVTDELKRELKNKRKFEDTEVVFDESDSSEWVKKSKSSVVGSSSTTHPQWNAASSKKKRTEEASTGSKFKMENRRGRGRGGSFQSTSYNREMAAKTFVQQKTNQRGLTKLQKPETPPYAVLVGESVVPIPQTNLFKFAPQVGVAEDKGKQKQCDGPFSFAAVVSGIQKLQEEHVSVSRKLILEDGKVLQKTEQGNPISNMEDPKVAEKIEGRVAIICNNIEASSKVINAKESQKVSNVLSLSKANDKLGEEIKAIGEEGMAQNSLVKVKKMESIIPKGTTTIVSKAISDVVKESMVLGIKADTQKKDKVKKQMGDGSTVRSISLKGNKELAGAILDNFADIAAVTGASPTTKQLFESCEHSGRMKHKRSEGKTSSKEAKTIRSASSISEGGGSESSKSNKNSPGPICSSTEKKSFKCLSPEVESTGKDSPLHSSKKLKKSNSSETVSVTKTVDVEMAVMPSSNE